MSGHTPGPWKRGHMGDAETAWIGPDYDQTPVAKVDRNDRDEWEANARLIAASPEMLEALYQYESDLLRPPTADSLARRLERVRKVIAKATGETS